jgi:hypothetical protein
MRIIIPNHRSVEETKGIVERSTGELFRAAAGGVIQIKDVEKRWVGDTMSFTLKAAVAFLSTDVEGCVAVTEKEVTIDIKIPEGFRRFVSEDKLKTDIEGRVRALLV